MTPRAAGIVLAGGASRRMGHDKSRLLLGGVSLLDRVVERVAAVCQPVVVVARRASDHHPRGATVVGDTWPGAGPLGGLVTGLGAVDAPFAALVACDLPFVEPALLAGLVARAAGWNAAVPRIGDRPQPHCAVYRREVQQTGEPLLASGARALHDLLAALGDRVLYLSEPELRAWDPALRTFTDVNTPEDLTRAEALLAGG